MWDDVFCNTVLNRYSPGTLSLRFLRSARTDLHHQVRQENDDDADGGEEVDEENYSLLNMFSRYAPGVCTRGRPAESERPFPIRKSRALRVRIHSQPFSEAQTA